MSIGTNVLDTAVAGLNQAFKEFRESVDKKLEIVDKTGETTKRIEEDITKIQKRIEIFDGIKTRIEKLEVLGNRPVRPGEVPDEVLEAKQKHLEVFEKWFKSPRDFSMRQELYRAEEIALQSKALRMGINMEGKQVSTTTPAAGGYGVPTIIFDQVEDKLRDATVMRQVATVRQVASPDYKELVTLRTEGYGWVGETDVRSPTAAPTLGSAEPTFGTIYSYPSATEESLDDIFFDVPSWLVENIVDTQSWGEGLAYMTGDGSNKPTGLLDGTPVPTDDGARAFGVLQYVPSGDANGFPPNAPAASTPTNPVDPFIDVEAKLKAQYRRNAVYMVNRNTAGVMMKFQDADGNKMWQRNLQQGMPPTFNGYSVFEDDTIPDIAANAFPVVFGDMAGYLICDRVGIRITLDDNITQPGYVKWYIRRRVGGILKNDDRIKLIKIATS